MAEELTSALRRLAERGEPRGAGSVLTSARRAAADDPTPWWVREPVWVAAATFAATLLVLGGSLVVGLALRRPGGTVGAGGLREVLEKTSSRAPGEWLLIPLIAAVAAITALVVRAQLIGSRKEKVMATTVEKDTTSQQARLEETTHTNRGLVIAVVILAAALVALSAWVIYDQASQPETAVTTEVEDLLDDYLAANNEADAELFRAITTEDYIFNSFNTTFDRSERMADLALVGATAEIIRIGDPIMMNDGPDYFVTTADSIAYFGGEYVGVSAFRIVDTDEGLRISEHFFVGNL